MWFNLLSLIILFLVSQNVHGQSLSQADRLFDNFEFVEAIDVYKELDKQSKLSPEHKEKLAYCYYITGTHQEGLPYIKTLIKPNDDREFLWLWKGTLEKESNDFENAIVSLQTFKTKTKDLNEEVDIMIESCKLIPTWDSIPRAKAINNINNAKSADSFSQIDKEYIQLVEIGIDSSNSYIDLSDSDNRFPEMYLMRPVDSLNDEKIQLKLFENYPNLSVSRIHLNKLTSELFFSAADPLNKNEILKSPQIYTARYTSGDIALTDIKLWEFSGTKDSSSCNHPTLSLDGNRLIFTKSSKSTKGSDLYFSEMTNGSWSKPVSLDNLNTSGNEMFPVFQSDSSLTFSSDGRIGYGGLDIYKAQIINNTISSEIQHFHEPVNSALDDFNFHWRDSVNITLVSNRSGGKGDDDIWSISIEKIQEPIVDLPDGFIEWYEQWNLKPIYFDFDSFEADVNKDFILGCKKYLEKYGVAVKLVGHTDSRGTNEYNHALGLNRSKWLQDQLISAEVKNPISIESVGETQLVNSCMSGIKCTEEEHLMNRFVKIQLSFNQIDSE